MFPDAEAVVVAYHVLRKADLTFTDNKSAVPPKIPESEPHKIVSQMLSDLDYASFLPEADQVRCFDLLNGEKADPEQYLHEAVSKHFAHRQMEASTELTADVIALLQDDADYDFLAKAKDVFSSIVQKTRDLMVPPKDPESQAHQAVSKMLALYKMIDFYPEGYKRRAGTKLHLEGASGVNEFLTELIEGHSKPKRENPHALMSGASAELKAEVMTLLQDDAEYYNFVSTSRRYLPKPDPNECSSYDRVAFQPPALGGAHTDVSAEEFLGQFRSAIPEDHELGTPAPGRKRRVVFLKFWRNIADSPIVNHHLAVLDKSCLRDSDMHEAEINFKGIGIKQNRLNPDIQVDKLRWVYFPHMHRDEILCFQQGDLTLHGHGADPRSPNVTFPGSRQDHATFHTAFDDPTAPSDAAPRQSIEAAAFVLLPEEPEVVSKF